MSHHCHAVGCDKTCPPKMFMCRTHWFSLPATNRAQVYSVYRPGQEIDKRPSAHYLEVTNEARKVLAIKEDKLDLWERENVHYEMTIASLRKAGR